MTLVWMPNGIMTRPQAKKKKESRAVGKMACVFMHAGIAVFSHTAAGSACRKAVVALQPHVKPKSQPLGSPLAQSAILVYKRFRHVGVPLVFQHCRKRSAWRHE